MLVFSVCRVFRCLNPVAADGIPCTRHAHKTAVCPQQHTWNRPYYECRCCGGSGWSTPTRVIEELTGSVSRRTLLSLLNKRLRGELDDVDGMPGAPVYRPSSSLGPYYGEYSADADAFDDPGAL